MPRVHEAYIVLENSSVPRTLPFRPCNIGNTLGEVETLSAYLGNKGSQWSGLMHANMSHRLEDDATISERFISGHHCAWWLRINDTLTGLRMGPLADPFAFQSVLPKSMIRS